jgi:hypothetical protein
MAIPFDADIDMQGNKVANPVFDAGAIPFAALALPAADVSLNSHKITSLANGSARSDGANYGQVLDAINGTPWADAPVITVFTTNVALTGEYTNDGVTTSNSRALLTGQSTASQNGLWVTNAGAWTRAADLPVGKNAASFSMYIEQGTLYQDTQWRCTSNTGSAVVGTDNLVFVQFAAGVAYSADGATLQLVGTTFSVKTSGITANELAANAVTTSKILDANVTTPKIADDAVTTAKVLNGNITDAKLASTFCKKYSASIGNGSLTTIAVTHNLGTRDVLVQLYTNSGNYDTRNVVVQRTDANTVTLVYNTAPASNAIRVVVIG